MTDQRRRVGRYDLLEVIGRGGAAVVYLAHQRDLDRRVALKELAPIRADDPTFAERFIAESRLTSSMNHPNVVTVHEFFDDDGVPYIAMEYLPRGSLRRYIGRLRLAHVAGVLEGVLAGLSHGERRGIVHRDLKPENLLVTEDGRVKIADFGVARAYKEAAPREPVTATGATIGTPTYMAPEQALAKELTPAADLYSLGVVAWEMLAGRVPFEGGDSPMAVLYRHVHEPLPAMYDVAPDVDPRLATWVERMLAKEPGRRFASADAAWDAFEDVVLDLLGPRWRREARLVEEDAAGAERPLTPATFEKGPAVARRSRWRPRIALTLVLAALAGGGVAIGLAAAGGGNPSGSARLSGILRTLSQTQARDAGRLKDASTAPAQAAAASAIADSYATAARKVNALPRTRTTASVGHEVSATQGAYDALARAARSNNRAAYDAAIRRINTDQRRLQATASRL